EPSPRFLPCAPERPACPEDVERDDREDEAIGGPHVPCVTAHGEELSHQATTSRIHVAARSRRSTSPRNRTSNSAPKSSVNPTSIRSSGTSISVGMLGLSSFITDAVWCSE